MSNAAEFGFLPGKLAVDLIQNRERQGASRRFLPVFFKQSPAASALPLTKSTACQGEKVADRPDEGAELELI